MVAQQPHSKWLPAFAFCPGFAGTFEGFGDGEWNLASSRAVEWCLQLALRNWVFGVGFSLSVPKSLGGGGHLDFMLRTVGFWGTGGKEVV